MIARYAGVGNLAYALAWAGVAAATGRWWPFVAATSFVHYGLYLVVFARRDWPFDRFVRDAVLFKTLSMAELGWIWLTSGPGIGSVALVSLGVGLSCWAASVLGFERTYFGVELGRVPPARIARAPYGWVPHPMILGALVALLGVELVPAVRAGWPWLVPIHVALYLAHLLQEVLDG